MPDNKKWSRDWAHFGWSQVRKKFDEMKENEGEEKANYDVGISRDEFLEYLDWLNENDKEGYYKAVLSMQLMEIGLDDEEAASWVSRPEELIKIIEMVLNKKDNPE